MSLLFPYKIAFLNRAAVSLGGRSSRPRPLLISSVIGPHGTDAVEGRLDTGSDETLFSARLAARIGVDLRNAPLGQITAADGSVVSIRYAQVTLQITDGKERREWPAWVGFSAAIRRPLFGFAGFLQFFTATFHGDRELVELTINRLYPGI
jgi:hypothetical protein